MATGVAVMLNLPWKFQIEVIWIFKKHRSVIRTIRCSIHQAMAVLARTDAARESVMVAAADDLRLEIRLRKAFS